ncbi:hypothetical protein ACM64Y_03070 [Novispirillum sp. DQ9]|uniref:hypothetical protein n=1 Tax=Novispirillum sp. DQ9 TaxID=3398612 RepID=UPI003C7B55D2
MGVLIIGAIGLLGYGVYSKLDGGGKSEAADGTAPPVAAAPAPPAPTSVTPPVADTMVALGLDQPDGSRIAGASTDGPLLTLRIEGGDRPDRVAVIDLRTGTVAGWVHVRAAPAR